MSFSTEPSLWIAAIKAIILAAVTFGLKWTAEQIAAIVFAMEAIGSLIVRQSVVSVKKIENSAINRDSKDTLLRK